MVWREGRLSGRPFFVSSGIKARFAESTRRVPILSRARTSPPRSFPMRGGD